MTAMLRVEEPSAQYLVEIEPTLPRGFELLVTAPSGIARLRELICSLAVRGKLLPQDPFDQPAAGLLAPLHRERARLIEAGRVRKDRDADADKAIQLAFDLPRGWAAARLADVAWPQAGFAFKSSAFNAAGHGLPLIRIRDVGANSPTMYFSGEFREEFIVRLSDWLIGMDGDFRVAQWSGPDALLNQRVTRLVFFGDEIEQLYVTLALQIELRKLQGTKAYTTVDHLSGSQIASRVIALPPIAEQHRIVARVEELMKLCDALEQNGRLADEQHARLTSTLFDALATSESAHALAENWQRVAEHFDLLLDRVEATDTFEQTVLQLAVRGALVSQDPRESNSAGTPANQRLVESNVDDGEEADLGLPASWRRTTLGEVTRDLRYGTSAKCAYDVKGVPVLRIPNLTKGRVLVTDLKFGSLGADEADRLRLEVGDLLIVRSNGSASLVGSAAIVGQDAKGFAFAGYLMRLRVRTDVVLPSYVLLVLETANVRNQIEGPLRTTSGVKNINSTEMARIKFPLPPLGEQHRIVAHLEELRGLCANLRQKIAQARSTQFRLADALVAEVA